MILYTTVVVASQLLIKLNLTFDPFNDCGGGGGGDVTILSPFWEETARK